MKNIFDARSLLFYVLIALIALAFIAAMLLIAYALGLM